MTKRARIEELAREGKKRKEICEITGFSYGYISNILGDLSSPGSLAAAKSRWLQKSGWKQKPKMWRPTKHTRQSRLKWKKDNPEKHRRHRHQVVAEHQNATLPSAKKHYQEWSLRDIEFLERNGNNMSIRQLALALGRTYISVQGKAHKLELNLRGDKMGAGSNRFKEIYRKEASV